MNRMLPLLTCIVLLSWVLNPSQASALVLYNFRTISQTIIDTPCEFYGGDYCNGFSDFYGATGQLIFSDGVKKQGNHMFSLELPGELLGFYFEGFGLFSFNTYWVGNGVPAGGPILSGTIANGELLALTAQFSHGAYDGGFAIAVNTNEMICTTYNPFIQISAEGTWEGTYLPIPEPGSLALLAIGLIMIRWPLTANSPKKSRI